MFKYVAGLVIALVLVVAGLVELRGGEMFTLDKIAGPPLVPRGELAPAAAPAANDLGSSGESSPTALSAATKAVSGVLSGASAEVKAATGSSLSSDPATHTPTPKMYDTKAAIDPERRKRYQDALGELDVQGCNGNGTFSYQLSGRRTPRTLRSGEAITFSNGLVLTARMAGFPNCRITLSDGTFLVAELSSF
jgi:hypothetical protein